MAVCGQFEWSSIEQSEMERRARSGRGDTSRVPTGQRFATFFFTLLTILWNTI